jgi:hypothetical protein
MPSFPVPALIPRLPYWYLVVGTLYRGVPVHPCLARYPSLFHRYNLVWHRSVSRSGIGRPLENWINFRDGSRCWAAPIVPPPSGCALKFKNAVAGRRQRPRQMVDQAADPRVEKLKTSHRLRHTFKNAYVASGFSVTSPTCFRGTHWDAVSG